MGDGGRGVGRGWPVETGGAPATEMFLKVQKAKLKPKERRNKKRKKLEEIMDLLEKPEGKKGIGESISGCNVWVRFNYDKVVSR